jgi:MinD superfamily P-loop ATPase
MDMTKKIERYCHDKAIQVIGKLGFDRDMVKAMIDAKTIVEYADGRMKTALSQVWDKLHSDVGGK